MSPGKHLHIQSRPFKGDNFQHIVSVTAPSFQYTPDVICPACLELLGLCLELERLESSLVPQSFFTTFEYIDVLCSATLGCHLCSLFCSSARWDFRDTDYTLFGLCVRYELTRNSNTSDLFNLRLCLTDGKIWTIEGTDTLHMYPRNQVEVKNWEAPPSGFPHASLGRSTGDPETTAVARAWLQKCLQEHSECRETDEETDKETRTKLPARLLDLEGGIKLVDYTETGENTPYVTLSHCWGKAHLICLLESNEDQFRRGDITGLPKTFLEAIQVTRDLGYRYIWIDSLCIIQDSENGVDWLHQAKNMAFFYTNSVFTIAALKSSGSRQGCFTAERSPLGRRALHHSGLGISVWPGSSRSMWETEVGRIGFGASPLHSRAWVVQERYSSPRTLLYGKNGIYWECRSAQASETHYREVEPRAEENKKTWLQRLLRFGLVREEDEFDGESWMKHWKGLLSAYSSCELTKYTDKIIAVTGLVSLIEARSSPSRRCIWGLWDHDLPRMALWNRSPDSTQTGLTDENFPSWSWASVKGTCTYMLASGRLERAAEIHLHDNTAPATMVVRSWRRRVLLDKHTDGMDGFLFGAEDESSADDEYELIPDPKDIRKEEKGWINNLEVQPYSWYPDRAYPGADTELHLVEIQRFLVVEKSEIQSEIRVSWCLVITPKVGGAGKYQRVGLCLVRCDDPRDYPFTDDKSDREVIDIV